MIYGLKLYPIYWVENIRWEAKYWKQKSQLETFVIVCVREGRNWTYGGSQGDEARLSGRDILEGIYC